ncbi:MAG: efflux RND transporter periplasmic adaptor subunit [Planctomycetota bacterium]
MSKNPKTPARGGRLRVVAGAFRALAGLIAIGLAVLIYVFLSSTAEQPARTAREISPPIVETAPVRMLVLPRVWEGFGTARAMEAAELRAQVEARVTERPATTEPGLEVTAGQLLLQLDTTDFAAAVTSAEQRVAAARAEADGLEIEAGAIDDQVNIAVAELDLEERLLQREQDALEGGAGSTVAVERTMANVRRVERTLSALQERERMVGPRRMSLNATVADLEAELKRAQANLDRTTIASPIDGVIQRVDIEAGELARIGAVLARVVDLSRVEVPLRLPISADGLIEPDSSVELREDGPSPRSWAGTVSRIAPEADADTRTMTVFVEVVQDPTTDADRLLRPGQFVIGRIETTDGVARPVVPRRALQGDRLFIAEPARRDEAGNVFEARRVEVRVAHTLERSLPDIDPRESQWTVLSDLPPQLQAELTDRDGVEIVLSNLNDLEDGSFIVPAYIAAAEQAQTTVKPTSADASGAADLGDES